MQEGPEGLEQMRTEQQEVVSSLSSRRGRCASWVEEPS
jgi:hypothetical protein